MVFSHIMGKCKENNIVKITKNNNEKIKDTDIR